LEALADFESAFARQNEIEDDEVRLAHHEDRLRLPAVLRDENGVMLALEQRFEKFGGVRFVFDEQNALHDNVREPRIAGDISNRHGNAPNLCKKYPNFRPDAIATICHGPLKPNVPVSRTLRATGTLRTVAIR